MKINRDNYEEYFLLYADDELPAEMREEVELFVLQNPDLRGELKIFQELKMHPDMSIGLEDKSFLRKEAQPLESTTEETMLLHLDGELDPHQVQRLEAEIASNDQLGKTWEILQKTKLPLETIAFPWKETLYRKDSRVIPLFRAQWVRYAAAAAVILVSGLLWLSQSNQEPADAVGGIAQQFDLPKDSNKRETLDANPESSVATGENTVEGNTEGRDSGVDGSGNRLVKEERSGPGFVSPNNKSSVERAMVSEKMKALPAAVDREDNHQQGETLIAQTLDNKPVNPVAPEITDQAVGNPESEIKADYATRALMEDGQPEPAVYENGQPTRKGPLRGIVRKANRIFHKVTNPDMDKPLVKVASFEIALAN